MTAPAQAEELSDGLDQYLARLRSLPLLTAAQEVALAKRIEAGDQAARRALIESNLAWSSRSSSATAAAACP